MQSIAAEAFNRHHRLAGHSGEARHARARGLIVHEHSARAAGALTAAVFGSDQVQFVAEHRQQAVVWIAVYLVRAAVDPDRVGGHGDSLHLRCA